MNKTQKARLIRIVKSDCLHGGQYFSDTGKTCVIGAMALAVRFKRVELEAHNEESIPPVFLSFKVRILNRLVKILCRAFGLTGEQLGRIQELNDRHATPQSRRKSILKYINTIP